MSDLMYKAEIQGMVRAAYRAIDAPTGAAAGYYPPEMRAEVPAGAVAWALGVGNPIAYAELPEGAHVLDVGCGAGIDTLLAARRVGSSGHVTGLDLLPEMVERARAHTRAAGIANATFVQGEMEAIPLPDDSVDAIISNGVINLSARKMRTLFECARVLRPGGRFTLCDVTIDETDLPPEVLTHPAAWSGCAAGAMAERALVRALGRVGMTDVVVREHHPLSVDDCARFPLFTSELLAIMRALIPPGRPVGICVTVTSRRRHPDDPVDDVIASGQEGNEPVPARVLTVMDDELREFSVGDRACGDGVGRDLRAWWAACPPGSRTVVSMTDPSTKADVPSLARMLGHTVEDLIETDGTLRVTVRTKGART